MEEAESPGIFSEGELEPAVSGSEDPVGDPVSIGGVEGVCLSRGNATWGPMKKIWKFAAGNRNPSCSHTWGGREDSPRAPRIKIRTWDFPTDASCVSGAPGSV